MGDIMDLDRAGLMYYVTVQNLASCVKENKISKFDYQEKQKFCLSSAMIFC